LFDCFEQLSVYVWSHNFFTHHYFCPLSRCVWKIIIKARGILVKAIRILKLDVSRLRKIPGKPYWEYWKCSLHSKIYPILAYMIIKKHEQNALPLHQQRSLTPNLGQRIKFVCRKRNRPCMQLKTVQKDEFHIWRKYVSVTLEQPRVTQFITFALN